MATAVRAANEPEPQAALRFTRSPDGVSYIGRQRVGYPFHITRPFMLDTAPAGALTLYLQSVSGGIYDGEDLRLDLTADENAEAHVTTQAATIVHRTPQWGARQSTTIDAAPGALLEYLPDPLILFPEARLESQLEITAAPGATVLASESFSQHDPKGLARPFDRFEALVRVARPDGALLAMERYGVAGSTFADKAAAAAAWPAQGSLLVIRTTDHEAIADALRSALEGAPVYAGVSALPNACGLSLRVLAPSGAALRGALDAAWSAVRVALFGVAPPPRRK